ncbi:MAG TPA: HAMP domain-containing sensor histidine kinase, partial [Chloroflexota bacterium]|nr:HAMP domain-containing sensor histidine kinase [Chloroflexota bacterium]
ELAGQGIDFVLKVNGRTVYRSVPDPLAGTGANNQRTVQRLVVPGRPGYVAFVYSGRFGPGSSSMIWLAPLAGLLVLLLTLGVIAWLLRRTVIRPLAATSAAARQIAAGNLTITIPDSRVREIADLKRSFLLMSNELSRSLRQQANLEEERRLFIGAIAHDLRTPLFSLRGYLEGLEQGLAKTPEKAAEYIRISREKADALERLVADLFAYTRIEYLEQTLQREPFELNAVLEKVVEGRRREAHARDISLQVHGPSRPARVVGDEHLMSRAVENLLDNALRHTPDGGRIGIDWSVDGNVARFAVIDTGPGIDPRDLPHLFEPMYRADAARNGGSGGAGLGLTIARRILRAHGGDLSAANAEGAGAEFSGSVAIS